MACLEDDFEACIAHLRFPLSHRRAIRTTNLLERLFGEERRRTKVITVSRQADKLASDKSGSGKSSPCQPVFRTLYWLNASV